VDVAVVGRTMGDPYHFSQGGVMKRLAIRTAFVQVSCASALLLLAQPASAQPCPEGAVCFRAGTACDFAVSIVQTGEQQERVELPGVLIFTGRSTATVTNLETGASRTYNVSGPVQFDPDTNQVTLLGPSLVVEPERNGFLILTRGQVTFVLNEPIEEQLGTQRDVCADLD
jgi:hypothetical protein